MVKIIDGKGAVMGRLASYAAKQALQGEEIVILNCEEVIITGNKKDIRKDFEEKRSKVGSGQKGPKHSKLPERIVKRAIRGMLPNHRKGRGRQALNRVRCYQGVPKEFESQKKIIGKQEKKIKFMTINDLSKLR